MSASCRLLGHRPTFWAEGETLRWRCDRECGLEGSKTYPTAADARRYADALDRRESDEIGRRAPLSLLPLRLIRRRGV